jgi:hypothetical protein
MTQFSYKKTVAFSNSKSPCVVENTISCRTFNTAVRIISMVANVCFTAELNAAIH